MYDFNRRTVEAKREWVESNFDLCETCYRKHEHALAAQRAEKLALPAIKGVSERQVDYALSLRDKFCCQYEQYVNAVREVLATPDARKQLDTAAAKNSKTLDAFCRDILKASAQRYKAYIVVTSADAHEIIETLKGR